MTKKDGGIIIRQLLRYGFLIAVLIIACGFWLAYIDRNKVQERLSWESSMAVKDNIEEHGCLYSVNNSSQLFDSYFPVYIGEFEKDMLELSSHNDSDIVIYGYGDPNHHEPSCSIPVGKAEPKQ